MWAARIAERREDSTADTYRHWVDKVVLPRLGDPRLHECDVPRLDGFFSRPAREQVEAVAPDGSGEVGDTWPRASAMLGISPCCQEISTGPP